MIFDDALHQGDSVVAGAWGDGPYGPADTFGTYNEVTPQKTARSLASIDLTAPVGTFTLAETFFNGFPGWGSRSYEQHLVVGGLDPGPDFRGEVSRDDPRGPHLMTSLEERVKTTYNMGSKVNGLAHAGVGERYYGDRQLRHLIADHGVTDLDTATWGPPIVTRGLLIDVLGLKVAANDLDALEHTSDGRPVLRGDYRITQEDLDDAASRQRLPMFESGDAIFVRTGWSRLIRSDPQRFLAGSPGVWLRETHWLASKVPALVGTDSWCWGVNDPVVIDGAHGACHQVLLVRHGIRIGEGFQFEDLIEAGVDRFVLCHNPVRAEGAVSSTAPATAIANVVTSTSLADSGRSGVPELAR